MTGSFAGSSSVRFFFPHDRVNPEQLLAVYCAHIIIILSLSARLHLKSEGQELILLVWIRLITRPQSSSASPRPMPGSSLQEIYNTYGQQQK